MEKRNSNHVENYKAEFLVGRAKISWRRLVNGITQWN